MCITCARAVDREMSKLHPKNQSPEKPDLKLALPGCFLQRQGHGTAVRCCAIRRFTSEYYLRTIHSQEVGVESTRVAYLDSCKCYPPLCRARNSNAIFAGTTGAITGPLRSGLTESTIQFVISIPGAASTDSPEDKWSKSPSTQNNSPLSSRSIILFTCFSDLSGRTMSDPSSNGLSFTTKFPFCIYPRTSPCSL